MKLSLCVPCGQFEKFGDQNQGKVMSGNVSMSDDSIYQQNVDRSCRQTGMVQSTFSNITRRRMSSTQLHMRTSDIGDGHTVAGNRTGENDPSGRLCDVH